VITLVYLARLRETFGTSAEKVEPPRDVGTVAALLAWLRTRGGAWAAELARTRGARRRHHTMSPGPTRRSAGDEVALFPVTGG
jgi:molybdopterin synthase sulfur carrier subunit